ncbi:hypothetical protein [Rhizobium sp. AC44/96]|uniref:hypothetical protein n=1 Tax=Rhizobium sp. AC44/96 TaxID=1841654 RepID=UPI001146AC46|nr:hypothetical protein [Rhizobium sp. AC44/96]
MDRKKVNAGLTSSSMIEQSVSGAVTGRTQSPAIAICHTHHAFRGNLHDHRVYQTNSGWHAKLVTSSITEEGNQENG